VGAAAGEGTESNQRRLNDAVYLRRHLFIKLVQENGKFVPEIEGTMFWKV
jgi:hypothetical protein